MTVFYKRHSETCAELDSVSIGVQRRFEVQHLPIFKKLPVNQ